MRISRFRSAWGIDPGLDLANWVEWFPKLQNLGYSGVEVKPFLLDPNKDFEHLRRICDGVGFEIALVLQSSIPPNVGPRPHNQRATDHLQKYQAMMEMIRPLKPVVVTVQSGQDDWDIEESISYFTRTLEIDKRLGLSGLVCHETHRSRSLHSPWVTKRILDAVPQLKITVDFSHWVVISERLLDAAEDDRAVLDAIIPHVGHIHARIGTTQASQCPDPTNTAFLKERLSFESLWKSIIKSHSDKAGSDASITFVPEYGPFPYHPIGSLRDHGAVADAEGKRLHSLFSDFAATLSPFEVSKS